MSKNAGAAVGDTSAITVSPQSLDFGTLKSPATDTKALSVTFSSINPGAVTLKVSDPNRFSASGDCANAPFCDLMVNIKPAMPFPGAGTEAWNETLKITAGGNSTVVPLTATVLRNFN